MYRTVKELNESELDELRNNLYWELFNEQQIDDIAELDNNALFEHYEGINFVDDDFFCNE